MNGGQASLLLGAFLSVALAVVVGMCKWIPDGKIKSLALLILGAGPIVCLFLAGIPPKWFSGSAEGFLIGGTLLASAFSGRTASEKAFRLPFLFGFGATMLVLNVWAHV